MSATERKLFGFEGYTLDTMRGCLRAGEREIPLRPKSFELLRYLVQNAGRLVSKDELVEAIWRKVFVSDDSLTRCVSDVRQALGDGAQNIIKTVRGRGYLLAPPVSVSVLGPAVSISTETCIPPGDAPAPPGLPGQDRHFIDVHRSARTDRVFAITNVPIRVPMHFMGRDDALASIMAAFAGSEGRVAITTLHGLRGVGKTTLAAAHAERHRGEYRATWWIRAETEPTIRADLVALGVRLGWITQLNEEESALPIVMDRLRDEGERILLIYDNALDAHAITPYLPVGGAARVLVTSNAHAWRGIATPVEIGLWPKEIGADYLIVRTGARVPRAAAEALAEMLGGLPLAHEQAAAYCERLDISLTEYRERFEAAPARLLDDARHAPTEYHDGLTVAMTFGLAIDEAAKFDAAAEPLIVHAALLAPEPIPLFLFAEAHETLGDPLASGLAGPGLDEAVAALRAFALVDREVIADERDASIGTAAIRLHRLVREVAAARRDGQARGQLRRALATALAAVYPEDGYGNPVSWPRCASLMPHVLAICDAAIADDAADAECAALLSRAGGYFLGRAAYSVARLLLERALAIRQKALGPEHPVTARALNNLAYLLQAQGEFTTARTLFESALAIREKVLGPEHPDTALSLNNFARLLRDQGDYSGARSMFERGLAIREKTLGPDHPFTASSLNDLAELLQGRGDHAGAQPLLERALAIREKALGPRHPDTARTLNNFVLLFQHQGDLARSRLLCEHALAIREEVLGPEHPDTAQSLNTFAQLLQAQGNRAGARPLYERALAIRQKVLGAEHPATAASLHNLSVLLRT